jgi:hypothetical protein
MAHIGHPLVGDGKYGVNRADREKGYKYQALYAYRLVFDFKDESGTLGYLRGREVRLADADVWFLKDFEGGEVRYGGAPTARMPSAHKGTPRRDGRGGSRADRAPNDHGRHGAKDSRRCDKSNRRK